MISGVENAANAKGQRGTTARGGGFGPLPLAAPAAIEPAAAVLKGATVGICYALGHVWAGGKADVMASRDVAACTTEYGVQTANSKTILTVCSDLAEAERTLDMLGEGRLLRRTVRYSPWTAVDEDAVLG